MDGHALLERFYTTIGQYPTLYDFLAITREDLIQWEYHIDNPNTSVNPRIFRSTLLPRHCTLGRCCITCMIQVNQMTRPSVISTTIAVYSLCVGFGWVCCPRNKVFNILK